MWWINGELGNSSVQRVKLEIHAKAKLRCLPPFYLFSKTNFGRIYFLSFFIADVIVLIPHPSLMKSFHKNTKRGRTRLLWINWRKKLLFHISNSFQPSEPTASTGILYGKSQYNNLLITMFSIRLSQPCNESGSQYFCVLGVLLLQWFEGRRLYLVSLCVWPESGPEVKMYFFKASFLQW